MSHPLVLVTGCMSQPDLIAYLNPMTPTCLQRRMDKPTIQTGAETNGGNHCRQEWLPPKEPVLSDRQYIGILGVFNQSPLH